MKPIVSVVCMSYNHEKFITDALEGFVSQKTDFSFEVIIGDDHSTDKSQEIIARYAKKYPDIIKPVLRKKNMGAHKNFYDIINRARGKYIALCEGDDFWTDPTKLQRQVDFMDKHKNYSICFHPVRVIFENGELEDEIHPVSKPELTTLELLKQNYIQTNSVMYRARDYKDIAGDVMPGDWYLHLFHAQFGKIGYIDRVMSTYRRHEGGVWWDRHNNPDAFWNKYALPYIMLHKRLLDMYGDDGEKREVISARIEKAFFDISKVKKAEAQKITDTILKTIPEISSTLVDIRKKNEASISKLPFSLRLADFANGLLGRRNISFHLDNPISNTVNTNTVFVSGWAFSRSAKIAKIRARVGNASCPISYGEMREDITKAYSEIGKNKTHYSGFSGEVKIDADSKLTLEAKIKNKWHVMDTIPIEYRPNSEDKNIKKNFVRHKRLMAAKKRRFFEKEAPASYERAKDDPKLIAYYLPQFHPIPENDKAWGKGFTEWTNVKSAKPRFVGHHQPLIPLDLGYYDLRQAKNIKTQIDLAKKHGVYGFCFYYYWFSGKRLLEKPLDIFLEHKDWDFNFMISWANENWSKRWDGRDNDIIIAQKYLKDDPLKFIKDVEHILLDPRYITQDGKPVLQVYRWSLLDNADRYVKVWREYFKKKHGKELYILTTLSLDRSDPRPHGFDMGIEFEPLTFHKRDDISEKNIYKEIYENESLDKNFSGFVVDYNELALEKRKDFDFPTYKSVSPSWDNDARKKGRNTLVFYGSSPDLYAKWLDMTLAEETKKQKGRLVFINAWNEWGEGAILEPDQTYGYAVLNKTTEVLSKYSSNKKNQKNFPLIDAEKE